MSASYQTALQLVNEAIQLDGAARYAEAEAKYNATIHYLRAAVRDPSLEQAQRVHIMNYMSDVAKRIQALRAVVSQSTTAAASPASSATAGSSRTSAASPASPPQQQQQQPALTKEESDYLAFLDDMPKATARPAPAAAAKKKTASTPPPAPTPAAAGAGGKGTPSPPPSAPAPPPPPSAEFLDVGVDRAKGLSDRFAPRTSEFVLKAIEIATQLSRQGKTKRAVDVLDHAYQKGSRERHNPSNFSAIEDTLRVLRQRYYRENPPRFLQDNPILPEEIAILRRSGITSTILLPIWDDVQEGYGAANVFMPCEGVWEDSFTPQLCPRQKKEGAVMMHVKDLAPLGHEGQDDYFRIINEADPMNVKQTVVGDCSMVCSLIICASYQKRFPQAKIISNVIYPQDEERNPIVNPKGRYCVKMLINGMTRMVTIDDRLPAQPRSRKLLCTYSLDKTELWVSLMEKAFVKFCGGTYDFPGSSSASDLYKLSGWLPDSVTFGAEGFSADFHWRRLHHSFVAGGVLLTLSTADMTPETEKSLRLSGGHAYAVLDLREAEGKRVVLVRNPWSVPTWSGALSWESAAKSEAVAAVHAAVGLTKEMHDAGVFCISWEDITRLFDRCSLSWNPYLLYRGPDGGSRRPLRLACHGTFEFATSMGEMPQAHISVSNAPASTRMHLVLSRHIVDVSEFGRQHSDGDNRIPFLAVKVYDVTGYASVAQHQRGGACRFGMCYARRLVTASDLEARLQPLNDVVYRNMAAQTVSFDCPAGSSELIAVVTRTETGDHAAFAFSLTLHTELEQRALPFQNQKSSGDADSERLEAANAASGNSETGVFMHLIPKTCLRHAVTVEGAWEKGKSCGGRGDDSTFIFNPQYTLTLAKPAHVCLRLTTANCSEPAQLYLTRKKHSADGEATREYVRKYPAALRVGNVNADCDFIMQAKLFGYGGAAVDSALPATLAYDRYSILGEAQAAPPSKKLKVRVVSANAANAGAPEFTMYDVSERDEVSAILLEALLKRYAASPATSSVSVNGERLPLTAPLAKVFELGEGGGGDDEAGAGAAKVAHSLTASRGVRVALTLGDGAFDFVGAIQQKPQASGRTDFMVLFEQLAEAASSVAQRSSQLTSLLPPLAHIGAQAQSAQSVLSPPQAQFLQHWSQFLTAYAQRLAAAPRRAPAPRPLLAPLPAGTYTVVPSLWEKGVPGTFRLTAEATEALEVRALPEEGAGGLHQGRVTGQLLRQGTPLAGNAKLKPPLLISKDATYFHNSKVSITVNARCALTCRVLTIDPPGGAAAPSGGGEKREKVYVNVSLFRARDAVMMEMVAGSGLYTAGSASITLPAAALEAKTPYLAVVSASRQSDRKYALLLYGDAPFTARLTTGD